jgi:hypothetical protein
MGIDFQDRDELLVRVGSPFFVAANYTAAEVAVGAQTATVPLYDCRQIDCFIDFTALDPLTTEFHLKFRFSGKAAPDITVVNDWGYQKVDNIDPLTGFSLVLDYEIIFPPGPTARRHVVRITQISGTWVSAIAWINAGAATAGSVSFVRQGGT